MVVRDILKYAPVWGVFRFGMDFFWGLYRKRIAQLEKWGIVEKGHSILDVGCGTGYFSKVAEGSYTGIDLNYSYIEKSKSLNRSRPYVEFIHGDVNELINDEKHFDLIFCFEILHHLDDNAASRLLQSVRKIVVHHLVVMEPICEQTNFIGKMFIKYDRGEFIRSQDVLNNLIGSSGFHRLDEQILYIGPTRTVASYWRLA